MPKRIAFTGGRNQRLTNLDKATLPDFLLEEAGDEDIIILVGDCPTGIDKDITQFAKDFNHRIRIFVADWASKGKAAGPIRNKEMVQAADMLVAFPGGNGTDSAKKEAKKLELKIHEW